MSEIRSDMAEEALRLAEEAEREDLTLRLLGGVAIKLRAKDGLHPAFEREYADLDALGGHSERYDLSIESRQFGGSGASTSPACGSGANTCTGATEWAWPTARSYRTSQREHLRTDDAGRETPQGREHSYERYERT